MGVVFPYLNMIDPCGLLNRRWERMWCSAQTTPAPPSITRTAVAEINGLYENDFIMASKIDRLLDRRDGFLDNSMGSSDINWRV
jgi:hypothetical protein